MKKRDNKKLNFSDFSACKCCSVLICLGNRMKAIYINDMVAKVSLKNVGDVDAIVSAPGVSMATYMRLCRRILGQDMLFCKQVC